MHACYFSNFRYVLFILHHDFILFRNKNNKNYILQIIIPKIWIYKLTRYTAFLIPIKKLIIFLTLMMLVINIE